MVAGRQAGEALHRAHVADEPPRALRHLRQPHLHVVIAGIVVAVLAIDAEEAIERRLRSARGELDVPRLGRERDPHPVEPGPSHPARDRALPDQVVEPRLVLADAALQVFRHAREIRRPDGLVRLPRVPGHGTLRTGPAGQVVLAEALADDAPRRAGRALRHPDAVGAHVADQAHRLVADLDALIERLRDPHGPAHAEAELARGLLLQRRARSALP